MLTQAETFVNKLNDRAQSDGVRNAQEEVERGVEKVVAAQSDLTNFRNSASMVDPTKNSVAQLDLITQLTQRARRSARAGRAKRGAEPQEPRHSLSARPRRRACRSAFPPRTTNSPANRKASAARFRPYERLSTLKNLADKTLAGDVLSLESAKQEALRQQIYIEEVVSPNLPDVATEPHRLRALAQVFFRDDEPARRRVDSVRRRQGASRLTTPLTQQEIAESAQIAPLSTPILPVEVELRPLARRSERRCRRRSSAAAQRPTPPIGAARYCSGRRSGFPSR